MSPQDWAIELTKQFEARSGTGMWPQIKRADLAKGLRARVGNPTQIDQGDSNLCGVASFVRAWIVDDAVSYVWFAICLFERNAGMVSSRSVTKRVIRPSDTVRNSILVKKNSKSPDDIAAADWIVMAALRDDLNISLDYKADEGWLFWSDMRGLNSVSDVVKLFKLAGYREVQDYANWWARRPIGHLETAGHYVKAGYKVVLFIDSRLIRAGEENKEAVIATANHFVGLLTEITFDSGRNNATFKVHSWGDVKEVPLSGGWMPVKTIEKHYYGFVAARF